MMRTTRLLSASCALLVAACWPAAQAASGDVVVPAHRTRDGSYVPANVPPSSAGTYLARRPGKRSAGHSGTLSAREGTSIPMFAQAQSLRR